QVVAEQVTTPAGGLAPFAGLEAGQVIRDSQALALPADLQPGVYNLLLGRRRPDGSWLPVRRGGVPLGQGYPLATVHVLGRQLDLVAPTSTHRAAVKFGEGILLAGFDLQPETPASSPPPAALDLTLHWQALEPMAARYKIFAHLVGEGGPGDLVSQADTYPHLPTNGWVPGEYLEDQVHLDVPADLPPGQLHLLLGFYDERSGARLPVYGADGLLLGDSYELVSLPFGE
ncbi:MAG TPA: hypothetical protein VLC52_12735, partial [Anaerolineae bacterium]|nr:hypothetical protein [Anaerolineae bacterium]